MCKYCNTKYPIKYCSNYYEYRYTQYNYNEEKFNEYNQLQKIEALAYVERVIYKYLKEEKK